MTSPPDSPARRSSSSSASTGQPTCGEEMAADCEVSQEETGRLSGPAARGPRLPARRIFPGEARQLSALRRWLASLLPDCPARGDVTIVATELCSNAILHTASGWRGWFAVEISWHQPVVRVAVTDCGAPTEPRVIDAPAGEHGRGLLVVRGLSARTGACGDDRGRVVWAEVPWGEAGAAESASPQGPDEAAIRDGQAGLANRLAGVPAWFSRSTRQWRALVGGELVTASSARELACLPGGARAPLPLWPPVVSAVASCCLLTGRPSAGTSSLAFPRRDSPAQVADGRVRSFPSDDADAARRITACRDTRHGGARRRLP
jgi:anti-sigma regulatory factor (Ser/Thr protein kinase)